MIKMRNINKVCFVISIIAGAICLFNGSYGAAVFNAVAAFLNYAVIG